jgi:hypothetical protein
MRPPLPIQLGDFAEMRKPHACGANRWVVIRTGVDIRIKCDQCGRSVLMARADFEKAVRHLSRSDGEPSAR